MARTLRFAGTLLVCGVLIGLVELPLQWLSELGFALQSLWPMGRDQAVSPLVAVLPLVGSLAFIGLAWGPLAAGRGGGLAGLLALQESKLPEPQHQRALASLAPRVQLQRLPLLALTHLAGLTVGIESPSAALGATTLLALRRRIKALQELPLPLVAAIGGGAGLGAAFRSPLLGASYALEELSAEKGISLVLPTVALAGIGSLVTGDLGQPARLKQAMVVGLNPELWGWALVATVLAALVGVAFVRLLIPLADRLGASLRRQRWRAGLAVAGALTLLALASGGISLNDGSISLGEALAGQSTAPWWAAAPRFAASLLSIACGAPGGLMHDTMTLGALLAAPLVTSLEPADQAALIAITAAALFSGATRTPLFCGLFVFTLQGNTLLLGWVLLASALAAGLSLSVSRLSWSEHQREKFSPQLDN